MLKIFIAILPRTEHTLCLIDGNCITAGFIRVNCHYWNTFNVVVNGVKAFYDWPSSYIATIALYSRFAICILLGVMLGWAARNTELSTSVVVHIGTSCNCAQEKGILCIFVELNRHQRWRFAGRDLCFIQLPPNVPLRAVWRVVIEYMDTKIVRDCRL